MPRLLCCVLLLVPALGAQDAGSEEALKILRRVDRKLYVPAAEGLEALAFSFHPRRNDRQGKALGKASFHVRYLWRKVVGDRLRFVMKDGEVRRRLPKGGRKEHAVFRNAARSFRRSFVGRTLEDRFSGHRAEVRRRVVNHREKVSVLLWPRSPRKVEHLRLDLDEQLIPERLERRLLDGGKLEELLNYEARDKGHILASRKVIMTPATTAGRGFSYAIEYSYQRVSGFILPSRVRKVGPGLPAEVTGATSFFDVAVNDEVPEFKPDSGDGEEKRAGEEEEDKDG